MYAQASGTVQAPSLTLVSPRTYINRIGKSLPRPAPVMPSVEPRQSEDVQ